MQVIFPIPVKDLDLLTPEIPLMLYKKDGSYIILPLAELDNIFSNMKFDYERNFNQLKWKDFKMYLERIVSYKMNNINLKLNNKYKVTLNKLVEGKSIYEGLLTRIDGDYSVITIDNVGLASIFIENIEEI